MLQGSTSPCGDHESRVHGTRRINWRPLFASHLVRASCPGEQGRTVRVANRQSLVSGVQFLTMRSLMFAQLRRRHVSSSHEEEAYDSRTRDDTRPMRGCRFRSLSPPFRRTAKRRMHSTSHHDAAPRRAAPVLAHAGHSIGPRRVPRTVLDIRTVQGPCFAAPMPSPWACGTAACYAERSPKHVTHPTWSPPIGRYTPTRSSSLRSRVGVPTDGAGLTRHRQIGNDAPPSPHRFKSACRTQHCSSERNN